MALGLLILRLIVGLTLAAHGAQKLFGAFGGHGLAATGGFFENVLGFRPGKVHAALAGLGEFAGGLCLALGFLTPLGAAATVGVMTVAALAVHRPNGYFITEGGYEYTLILATAALTLAFTGAGSLSLDHALFGGRGLSGVAWGVGALVLGGFGGLVTLSGRHQLEAPAAAPPEDEAAPPAPAPGAVVTGAEPTEVLITRSSDEERRVDERSDRRQ